MRNLKEFSSDTEAVRLPPRRDVAVTSRVLAVIDHPVFQRLRRVKQLGPISLIYPGATHTRFEHSIGVYGVALEYLRALQRDPLSKSLTDADLQVCLLGALLHDLGHYPYAHNLEASHVEIGRASCRERVYDSAGAEALKKTDRKEANRTDLNRVYTPEITSRD